MGLNHPYMTNRLGLVSLLLLCFCLPGIGQERAVWQFDSLQANSSISKPDSQQVYEVLLKMLERWNACDIEGRLDVYLRSAELSVVFDSSSLTAGSNFMIPM